MNIYLIGYRCTGKTSIGRRLAAGLGLDFVDMDSRIAEDAGMSIVDMVAARGWDFFREKESFLLKEISAGGNRVVSTGGGVVLRPENRRRIVQSGVAVWLTAKPATIMRRTLADRRIGDTRPALTGQDLEKEVRDTLAERVALYAQTSDFAVATDHFGVEDVCRVVIEWVAAHKLVS